MTKYDILAKKNADDLEASYGPTEATSARDLMEDITNDPERYHIGDEITEVTVCAFDTESDEHSFTAWRDGEGWDVQEYDEDGNEL